MALELRVPTVGESITEVLIGDWLKQNGEAVRADEGVVVIETDKVTVELPAPAEGVISRQIKKKGDKAEVGEVIGYLEETAAGAKDGNPAKEGAKKSAPAAAPAPTENPPSKAASPKSAPSKAESPRGGGASRGKTVMPAAARELAQRGISADEVEASGPGGRLLKEDVLRHAPAPQDVAPAETRATPAAPPGAPSAPAAPAPRAIAGAREEQAVPLTPMRKRIAERLVQAQHTAAILTTFNEVDMSSVMALRKQHQERFVAKHKTKLGFMSFVVKASIEALKEFPQVNAEIRGEHIVYKNYYDVGIAVGGGKGLVVPILRNAERMSLAEIEIAIADFGARAQANKLALDELTGGTFTISNGGIYGSLLSTPILNPPQSGILGLHAIQDRPVARDGQVVIRPMMYVALSYDHRLVDGREAVTFLKKIKDALEDPARMLLEI
jgi:2-oxoglutarate dehydrogenase E2 component (dihydrolipoamide succinyltransferase)